jgi:hypothetical protein
MQIAYLIISVSDGLAGKIAADLTSSIFSYVSNVYLFYLLPWGNSDGVLSLLLTC